MICTVPLQSSTSFHILTCFDQRLFPGNMLFIENIWFVGTRFESCHVIFGSKCKAIPVLAFVFGSKKYKCKNDLFVLSFCFRTLIQI